MNCWLNWRDAGPTKSGAKYPTGNGPVAATGGGGLDCAGGTGTGDGVDAVEGAGDVDGEGDDCDEGAGDGDGDGFVTGTHQTSTSPGYSISVSVAGSSHSDAITRVTTGALCVMAPSSAITGTPAARIAAANMDLRSMKTKIAAGHRNLHPSHANSSGQMLRCGRQIVAALREIQALIRVR